ncbi:MAG: hypothetical protein KKA05_04680 [Alphaproteobacteria bacterium]|nr:hypothetical protein [Alphaproteobacteria bacterium]
MTDEIKQLRFRFREAANAQAFAQRMEDGSYNRTPVVISFDKYVSLGIKPALEDEVRAIVTEYGGHEASRLTPKPLWPPAGP